MFPSCIDTRDHTGHVAPACPLKQGRLCRPLRDRLRGSGLWPDVASSSTHMIPPPRLLGPNSDCMDQRPRLKLVKEPMPAFICPLAFLYGVRQVTELQLITEVKSL